MILLFDEANSQRGGQVAYLSKETGFYFTDIVMVKKDIDWQDPVLAYDILRRPDSAFLESVSGSKKIARFSFIALNPIITFYGKDGAIKITAGEEEFSGFGDPVRELFKVIDEIGAGELKKTMCGAIGYFGYDSARYIERIPRIADDDLVLPDVLFFIPATTIIFDHNEKKAAIYSLAEGGDRALAMSRSAVIKGLLAEGEPVVEDINSTENPAAAKASDEFISNFTQEDFERQVGLAKDYIFAGDVYQVNISQRLTTEISIDPYLIYKELRELNPSPFSAYFDFGDWQMVSCSPERLVKLAKDEIETRPIAGTIRRGSNGGEDKLLNKKLVQDIKERAEHIMLVDLERNDLGRVSDYGSVKVDELMVTESYSHVTHIVSNVVGSLSVSRTRSDLLRACFPGGTITGCPKVRAMEIIEELEPVRRGPYTGSMGYISFNGDMDLNIIIRTLVVKDGYAHIQAGAGIVADSIPEKEYQETLSKAEALIRATMKAKARSGRS